MRGLHLYRSINNNLRIERDISPAEPSPSPTPGPIMIPRRELTRARLLYNPIAVAPVYGGAGVEVGWKYRMVANTREDVESIWTSAGLDSDFARALGEGAGLRYPKSSTWVNENKEILDRILSGIASDNVLSIEFDESASSARAVATSISSVVDEDGRGINARAREIHEDKTSYTYVLSDTQWDSLHPAMIEFLTDISHSGFYVGDPVARVNERLIANHGDHLAQFEAVAELFGGPGVENTGLSYSDKYYSSQVPPSRLGNTETFFSATSDDLKGASTRESRAEGAFLNMVSQTLRDGNEVTVEEEGKIRASILKEIILVIGPWNLF